MEHTDSRPSLSLWRLVFVPSLISLAITLLRLVGELRHWSPRFFNAAPGGAWAIVGISWLPFIFGPYFALRLAGAGERPASVGKAFGWTLLGLGVYILGGYLFASTVTHASIVTLSGFVIALIAAFLPRLGWRALGDTLLAYALAARIPVVVIMLFAIRGNAGQGWGTHYDVSPPNFPRLGVWAKFAAIALVPQLTLWIGFTVVLGALAGTLVAAAGRSLSRTATVEPQA